MSNFVGLWQFQPGQECYVRHWPQTETGLIIAQLQFLSWPHYLVADAHGGEWQISQLELSTRPIPTPR